MIEERRGERGNKQLEQSLNQRPCGKHQIAWKHLSFPLGSQRSSSVVPQGPPIYVDLAYIPNHCSSKNVDQEFFKRVRSAYYVVSGNDVGNDEPSRVVLDALLEGKAQWGSNLQVTNHYHRIRWSSIIQLMDQYITCA